MAAGSIQAVLVCAPALVSDQVTAIDQQICPPTNGQSFHLQQQQAYVLTPDSAGYIDSIAQPFDYIAAAGFWGVAFTTIISVWLVSHGAGAIVNFVRRA
ncbi:hypothetical protein [Burkholderia sp. MSMB2157WGS]|jgi:hypothetical protein|uniref:hypothetical protein n=1 Tax=Burkholderia sp. MSMB2157WGS TaxID=1637928 RepID=UPI00211D624D|nr:hypothetical protein [Burkholderia sp. MSMB2157WGS]